MASSVRPRGRGGGEQSSSRPNVFGGTDAEAPPVYASNHNPRLRQGTHHPDSLTTPTPSAASSTRRRTRTLSPNSLINSSRAARTRVRAAPAEPYGPETRRGDHRPWGGYVTPSPAPGISPSPPPLPSNQQLRGMAPPRSSTNRSAIARECLGGELAPGIHRRGGAEPPRRAAQNRLTAPPAPPPPPAVFCSPPPPSLLALVSNGGHGAGNRATIETTEDLPPAGNTPTKGKTLGARIEGGSSGS